MEEFPKWHPDYLRPETPRSTRLAWHRDAASHCVRNVHDNESAHAWIEAYQAVRQQLLAAAWSLFAPRLAETSQYILLGSASRGEDLIGSDLDFAILLHKPIPKDTLQAELKAYIRIMGELGWPPCQGFVMGLNPRWIGTIEAWSERIAHYAAIPDWENTRYLFMLLDSKTSQSSDGTWSHLLHDIAVRIRDSRFLCWAMAHLGIRGTVDDAPFRRFMPSRGVEDRIDIKEGLIKPIVHAVRLLAIDAGFESLPTMVRVDFLREIGLFSSEQHAAIRSSLETGWRLRLLLQAHALLQGETPTDAVNLRKLPSLDLNAMRSSVHTAKWLTQLVTRRYPKPRWTP